MWFKYNRFAIPTRSQPVLLSSSFWPLLQVNWCHGMTEKDWQTDIIINVQAGLSVCCNKQPQSVMNKDVFQSRSFRPLGLDGILLKSIIQFRTLITVQLVNNLKCNTLSMTSGFMKIIPYFLFTWYYNYFRSLETEIYKLRWY